MLEKRIYARAELVELFKTDRLDAIKNKIKRAGYTFTSSGRGSEATVEILDLPKENEFKQYCIETLRFSPQTDFRRLKLFLYLFLEDNDFLTLQINEMAQEMNDRGISVSPPTISNYFHHLQEIGWCSPDYFDYVYFLYDVRTKENRYITQEEYKAINKEFWQLVKIDKLTYGDALRIIQGRYGNKPRKRPLEVKTAFVAHQYKAVWDLIENDMLENKMEG